jgi:hypothetical protein
MMYIMTQRRYTMDCINHVLLEVYCWKDEHPEAPYPPFCPTKGKYAAYPCLFHKCPYVDFTSCEDTLCYIGREADEVYGISFGGDMEEGPSAVGVDTWEQIAVAKIDEAYEEFMAKKSVVDVTEQAKE